jgi:hypoxanthine phosphoribosyltransferase
MDVMALLIPIILVIPGVVASLTVRMVNDRSKQRYGDLTLLRGKEISKEDANTGLKKLISYANKFEPDFIIGINRGGLLIGAFIALALGIPSKNFKRCCVVPISGDSGGYDIDCSANDLVGKVLVVDSIIRTGGSMTSTVKDLQKRFPSIEINTATLATVTDKDKKSVFEGLDYCVFGTQDRLLKLPWSEVNPNEGADYLETRKERSPKKKRDFQHMESQPVGELASEMYECITNGAIAK